MSPSDAPQNTPPAYAGAVNPADLYPWTAEVDVWIAALQAEAEQRQDVGHGELTAGAGASFDPHGALDLFDAPNPAALQTLLAFGTDNIGVETTTTGPMRESDLDAWLEETPSAALPAPPYVHSSAMEQWGAATLTELEGGPVTMSAAAASQAAPLVDDPCYPESYPGYAACFPESYPGYAPYATDREVDNFHAAGPDPHAPWVDGRMMAPPSSNSLSTWDRLSNDRSLFPSNSRSLSPWEYPSEIRVHARPDHSTSREASNGVSLGSAHLAHARPGGSGSREASNGASSGSARVSDNERGVSSDSFAESSSLPSTSLFAQPVPVAPDSVSRPLESQPRVSIAADIRADWEVVEDVRRDCRRLPPAASSWPRQKGAAASTRLLAAKQTQASKNVLKPTKSAQRVRGKSTVEQREKAKLMRKVGNCLRCKAFKLSCDASTPCLQCRKVENGVRTYLEPCYRDDLTKVSLARHGNASFEQRMVKFVDYIWANDRDPARELTVRWSLPGESQVDLPLLSFACREFVPKNNDTHFLTWQVAGQIIEIKLPPYAGCDTGHLKRAVDDFLDAARPQVLDYILASLDDDVARLTMKEALRYEPQSEVVSLALRIRCASFCSQGRGSIVGDETLGIAETCFADFGKSGYAAWDSGSDKPLPLSIDHQVDVALLLAIQDYQARLLKLLKRKILQTGEKPWYEIFLATFVAISNLEYVHGGSYSYVQALLNTKAEGTVSHLAREFIEEYNYSANNLLHHFRCMLRGPEPFAVAERSPAEFQARTKVDVHSMQYVREITAVLKHHAFPIPQQAGNSMVDPPDGRWLSQLFQGMHIK
ncbi:hypothetical protein LTR53_005168 [Teratosphaeriaceae sp. CCFEE 6253]|nr:hypothetical protein LTR53_005168 [Teratosphaeriaceae sp. CCFEE 6253]